MNYSDHIFVIRENTRLKHRCPCLVNVNDTCTEIKCYVHIGGALALSDSVAHLSYLNI